MAPTKKQIPVSSTFINNRDRPHLSNERQPKRFYLDKSKDPSFKAKQQKEEGYTYYGRIFKAAEKSKYSK